MQKATVRRAGAPSRVRLAPGPGLRGRCEARSAASDRRSLLTTEDAPANASTNGSAPPTTDTASPPSNDPNDLDVDSDFNAHNGGTADDGTRVAATDNDPSGGKNGAVMQSNGASGTGPGAATTSGINSETQGDQGIMAEVWPLLKFCVSMLCIAATSPLLSLVDTSVVGLASSSQLAAMAPATAISDGVAYCLTFIPLAVTNFVSLHMARRHNKAAGDTVNQGLALAITFGCTIAAGLLFYAPQLLGRLAEMQPEVLHAATEYVRWRAIGLPFQVGYSVLQGFFLACQAPVIPMMASLGAACVNAMLDLLLCSGFGMGAAGAAAATSAAHVVVFAIMLRQICKPLPRNSKYGGERVPVRPVLPNPAAAHTLLRVAGPILGVVLLKVLMYGMISARAAAIGPVVAAGHQILFSMALFFGTFGDTVQQAAQAFLPPRIGRPHRAWSLAKAVGCCGLIVAAFNGVVGTALVALSLPCFTSSAAVIATVQASLPLFTANVVLHCCSMSTEGICLAARDSWFLVASYAAAFGVLKVLLDLVMQQGWGLPGCWMAAVSFQFLRLLSNTARLVRPNSILNATESLADRSSELEAHAAGLKTA